MNGRLGVAVAAAIFTMTPATAAALSKTGKIAGVVKHAKTGKAIGDALVVLQCTCLDGSRETETNANGLYVFRDLPPGTYTIQVLKGEADVSKVTTLPDGASFRAMFKLDPSAGFKRVISVARRPIKMSPSTASHDSAGVTLGGTVSAESMYRVEGASVNNPGFGTVGSSAPPRVRPKQDLAAMRRDAVASREAAQKPANSQGSTQATAAPPEVETATPTDGLKKDFARQVVYRGTMALAVYKLEKTKEKVEALVVDSGGYVQSLRSDSMVLRIPTGKFRTVAAQIGKFGRLDSQEFEALDVTEDFYDLKTRIEVLRRTQKQLLELLGKARSVSDALNVRRELDQVTLQLEALLGKQRLLTSRIQFSALSVNFAERVPDGDVPSTNDPFPWVEQIGVERTIWR